MNELSERVFLHPGELYVSDGPTVISTVLGSCVSVVLWDGRRKVGGMNHYVLPESLDGSRSCKYGKVANLTLIRMMLDGGSGAETLDAYIIGGGSPVRALRMENSIGERNAWLARQILEHFRIRIRREDIGGDTGRKVLFDTHTGAVRIRETQSIRKTDWYDACDDVVCPEAAADAGFSSRRRFF